MWEMFQRCVMMKRVHASEPSEHFSRLHFLSHTIRTVSLSPGDLMRLPGKM